MSKVKKLKRVLNRFLYFVLFLFLEDDIKRILKEVQEMEEIELREREENKKELDKWLK